jgi:hypothetical protein
LAKKKKKKQLKNGHDQFLTTKYDVVVKKGRELSEIYQQEGCRGDDWRIYNYYSRPEIQRAIFEYAKGRKITVLRHFRTLYPEIKEPEDILYISLYHAERSNLWPSLHGQISRKLENEEQVCDFVIEIDYKRSWEACFRATRPIIEMFLDFGIHACVKFSGHCSAHVIIPGELFPADKKSPHIRSQLMQFVSKIVKHAEKLDRSFTSSAHFLRLAYSINEKTGLVSLPIKLEEFDYFSWQEARLEEVKVVDNWWGKVPADAQERMGEFLKFALQKKQFTVKQKREIAKKFRKTAVKPKIDPQKKIAALQQLAQPITDHQLYDSMLEAAGENLKQYEDKLSQKNIMTALEHLKRDNENQAIANLREYALEYDVELDDLRLVWRWELRQHDLEHYAKMEIQQAIYHETQNRRIQAGSDGPFVQFRSPQDIYWLAIFLHSNLDTNEHPAFYRSVARYDAQNRFMIDYDIILEADGNGKHQKSVELMESVIKILRELNLTFDLRAAGGVNLQAIIPSKPSTEKSHRFSLIGEIDSEVKWNKVGDDPTQPPPQSAFVESIRERLTTKMREPELVKIFKSDEFVLMTHSLNELTGKPCAPITM